MRRGPRVAALAVVSCVFAACTTVGTAAPYDAGDGLLAPRDVRSGTRLRARLHRIDGVLEVLRQGEAPFHDVGLDVDCAFSDEQGAHLGPGAASYCLPHPLARHREARGPFLDSACTELAAFPPSTADAKLAVIEPRDACSTSTTLREVLGIETRRVYLRDDAGACRQTERVAVQRLGEVVPLDRYVRAVEREADASDGVGMGTGMGLATTGRICTRLLAGDDGSRLVVGGIDRDRGGEAMRVGDAGDGRPRWVPVRVAFRGSGELLYGDASCSLPLASKIGRTATCPLTASVVLDGTCGAGRYGALGARYDAAFVVPEGGACSATTVVDQLVFGIGEPFAPEVFAAVEPRDVGGSRVRRRGLGAEGALAAWGDVIDVGSDEPCAVALASDGRLRCLPAAIESVTLFADAMCSVPAFAHTLTGCERSFARFIRDGERAFEALRELPTTFTRASASSACEPYAPPLPAKLFEAREVPPARFPPAVAVDD